jgi:hypothetical protein
VQAQQRGPRPPPRDGTSVARKPPSAEVSSSAFEWAFHERFTLALMGSSTSNERSRVTATAALRQLLESTASGARGVERATRRLADI